MMASGCLIWVETLLPITISSDRFLDQLTVVTFRDSDIGCPDVKTECGRCQFDEVFRDVDGMKAEPVLPISRQRRSMVKTSQLPNMFTAPKQPSL
jgi:hypothetical protein